MTDFVQVKLENGGQAVVAASFAERHDLKVLDKPATDSRGKPLPPKSPADLEPATAPGYDSLTVAELKAAIEQRNAVRDEDAQIPTSGNKADLVAALEATDESEEDQ